jgi:hypothetical protein
VTSPERTVPPEQLAAALELDLDDLPICLACLSFVTMAIDEGDDRKVRRQTNRMTPILWEEGLAQPARLALARARQRGIPGAAAALSEVERSGGRCAISRAIVRRLAEGLAARAQGDLLKMGFTRFERT